MKVELGAGSTLNILLDKALLALKRTLGKLTEKEIKFENEHLLVNHNEWKTCN